MSNSTFNVKAVLAGLVVGILGGVITALPFAIALVSAFSPESLMISDISSLTVGGVINRCWNAAPVMCSLGVFLAVFFSVAQGYVTAAFAPGAEKKNVWWLAVLMVLLSIVPALLESSVAVLGMSSMELLTLGGIAVLLLLATMLGGVLREWQIRT